MGIEEVIGSVLDSKPLLQKKGTILAAIDGNFYGIVPKFDTEDSSDVSGIIEYAFDEKEKVLEMIYIQNKNFHGCTRLSDYVSEKARKKGMRTLLCSVEAVAKNLGAGKMVTKTWILAARPKLLARKDSFFYNWRPESIEEHMVAVEKLRHVGKLRDKKVASPLVKYYKEIKGWDDLLLEEDKDSPGYWFCH